MACRKANAIWYFVPDVLANVKFPSSIFQMTRYATRVGWVEFLATLDKFMMNWYDMSNLIILRDFSFPTLKNFPQVASAKDSDDAMFMDAARKQRQCCSPADSLSRFQSISEMPLFQNFLEARLAQAEVADAEEDKKNGKQWTAYDFVKHNSTPMILFPPFCRL